MANIYIHNTNDTALAAMTGMLFINMPYISQQRMPKENKTYIGSDRSAVCFVRLILATWGKNEIVVQIAATLPIIVILFIPKLLYIQRRLCAPFVQPLY